MAVDYMGDEDPGATAALQAYWAAHYDVVFESQPADDAATLYRGSELHKAYCAECHSRPGTAFVAYPVAHMLKPLSDLLSQARIDIWLWQFHFLVSCLALAYLPFGKLFHLISVPVSLAVQSVSGDLESTPDNLPVRRALGLDACTHCGVCSRYCSVAPIMAVIDNPIILPSEKTGAIAAMATDRMTSAQHWKLAQGSDICTSCGRCTDVCPSGIDLQDLWQASQNDLARSGYPPPHEWIRNHTVAEWAESLKKIESGNGVSVRQSLESGLGLADNPDTFWACVQCTTCTNVCPVVAVSDNPRQDLDLTPQQVMNLMRLELKHMALGCRMVWDCVTCYKCQEHCPQGVPVADVLYELRNEACRRLNPETGSSNRRTLTDLMKA
jgi:heterodisulfide reductase subunit C